MTQHGFTLPRRDLETSLKQTLKTSFAARLSLILAGIVALAATACSPINVLGRSVPDSEYIAMYNQDMAREKNGLKPTGVHDENGNLPSWDEFWCTIGGTGAVPPTAQSRRLKRYIIEHRRALGLPELSCARD